jgi:tetratricopeptide (TPR) repeat protein
VAHTLMTESVIYHRKDQYDRERHALEHARELFRQNKNRTGEGKTLVHLSQAYPEVSIHPKTGETAFGVDGKKEMEEALAVFELAKDDSLAAIAAHGLAFIERNLSEFENARKYFVRAVKLCRQPKSFNLQAQILDNMGDMEMQVGNLKGAVEAYRQAVVIPQHEARGYWKTKVLVKLGDARRALGDDDGAGEAYQEAKDIAEKLSYDYGRALALEGLAETAVGSDSTLSKRLLYQAAQLFAESGYEYNEQKARKRAGEIDA